MPESGTIDVTTLSWLVHGRIKEGSVRVAYLLSLLAKQLCTETVFLLAPSLANPHAWEIPEGWLYSEKAFAPGLIVPADSGILRRVFLEESIVLGADVGEPIPQPFAERGVRCLIAIAVRCPEPDGVLVMCNRKRRARRGPFQVSYTLADSKRATAFARVISLDGVGEFLQDRKKKAAERAAAVPERTTQKDAWLAEKEELLRTHRGWFVAYRDGERVALEPSLERLIDAIDEKLGSPRRPCEFHEILEKPPVRRGPSPRLQPARHPENQR